MKSPLFYINGTTGAREEEVICEEALLRLLYQSWWGRWLAFFVARIPLISRLYGWWNTLPRSKRKIAPFVSHFHIAPDQWEYPLSAYPSFSAFFIRRLKPGARPLGKGVILPAEGRYLFYPRVDQETEFVVKGVHFTLCRFLQDEALAKRYQRGTLILARLAPSDYHRFHFPCRALPSKSREIPGWLYSVHPLTMRQRMDRLSENKRSLTLLKTEAYGELCMVEVGATCVGTIHQTYQPGVWQEKGAEKGYFSLGGSALALLAEEGALQIAETFLANSAQGLETLAHVGWSLSENP